MAWVQEFVNSAPTDEELNQWFTEMLVPQLMGLGLTQADMEIFSKLWSSKYGDREASAATPEDI